ncbi:MAG TPA: SRPBCC family protein [Longimicrobium sp.]|nr:SRPBCC family protein [Longimicrobium sp.]
MTTTEQTATTGTADREMVLTRDFDAPRELVFRAFTEPAHLSQWWGPDGFTTTTHAIDVRPGGQWRFIMHGPDGTDYPNRIEYREITPPERLFYLHDSDVDDDPARMEVTVTFEDLGGRTRLTMRTLFPTAEQRAATARFGAVELGNQTLRRLGEHLAKM